MKIYTVHAPIAALTGERLSPERFVFVRDGFHFWAFAASALWLIWHRLWLALLGYLVIGFGLTAALRIVGAGQGASLLSMLLLAIQMGFEGANLRRWTLSRGKWRQIDVVVADDHESAERRFFDRWPGRRDAVLRMVGMNRGSPPPLRAPDSGDRPVLGLFPEPGARR